MSESELIREVLEHLAANINGTEEISVLKEDGTVICRFPEKSEKAAVFAADLMTGTGEDMHCPDMENMTGLILRGKEHFAACYRIPDLNAFLGLYGKSGVNLGLLNSGSRSACSRIREILYVPEE